MARATATTPEQYLAELPEVQRGVISAVRKMILKHLPKGYREAMNFGMLTYEIPLERYPETYNKQPLGFVSLAAQKNYYSLYMCGYGDPELEKRLRDAFAKAGRKLDMGKSCIRFRSLDDLPLEAIGSIIGTTKPDDLIAHYEDSRNAAVPAAVPAASRRRPRGAGETPASQPAGRRRSTRSRNQTPRK